MQRLLGGVLVLFLAGCGSGQNTAATTPVQASTKGTYRLVSSGASVTSPGGVNSFISYSSGTLKLDDTGYTLSLEGNRSSQQSSGVYRLGTSVNTILNNKQGAFTLTAADPPFNFTGSYLVTRDFILTLNYDPFSSPDGLVTHTETWYKESDALRHP